MTKILIAEDSPTQAARLRHILEKDGYAVSVTHNGAEALARLREDRPEVVITDIMMPEMDGYQLCQRIKDDPSLKDILVVVLTALSDSGDIIRGLESGADNFIVKPYEEQALLSRIRDILANQELRRESYDGEGIEVYFAGQKHVFTSRPTHAVDLLLSSYDTSVQKSRELITAQDELRALNEQLEEKIAQLTAANAERERLLAAEQEARHAAEAAVRARDEFLSVAAHELKTPVTSLRGYSQVVLRQMGLSDCLDPVLVEKAMAQIDRQSTRLSSLVNQLLDLSRLEAGKLVLAKRAADISALVEEVVATLKRVHTRREFVVTSLGPLMLEVDSLRLEQVVTNLLDNAVKFSPQDSPVEVEVDRNGRHGVTIAVRDHGAGIPADQRAHVFERFYQANDGKWHGGMGLGLFISRQIVELHGGKISVECPEDGGTRFTVRLPVGAGDVAEGEG